MATLYEYFNSGDTASYYIFGVNWYAQTFTLGAVGDNVDFMAYSVKLKLLKNGAPAATLTASIRATSGGEPTGGDLCSATLDTSTLTGSPAWYELVFSSSTLLRASAKYAIVVRCPSAVDPVAPLWRHLSTGGYTGGSKYSSSDSGSAWAESSADDMMFEVWGDLEGSSPGGSIYPTDTLIRTSGIVRTFWAGIGGQSVYQAQLMLGGLEPIYISPISKREPESAVAPQELPSGAGYTQADFQRWLVSGVSPGLIQAIFGHFPTYREWVAMKAAGGIT